MVLDRREVRKLVGSLLDERDDARSFTDSESLLLAGRISSIEILQIVVFLEDHGFGFEDLAFDQEDFDFGRDVSYVAKLGLWGALAGFQVYLFYAFLLATGISISQLRCKRRQASWFRTEVLSRVTVVLFFCLVHIFNDERRTVSLGAHFASLFRLFGV